MYMNIRIATQYHSCFKCVDPMSKMSANQNDQTNQNVFGMPVRRVRVFGQQATMTENEPTRTTMPSSSSSSSSSSNNTDPFFFPHSDEENQEDEEEIELPVREIEDPPHISTERITGMHIPSVHQNGERVGQSRPVDRRLPGVNYDDDDWIEQEKQIAQKASLIQAEEIKIHMKKSIQGVIPTKAIREEPVKKLVVMQFLSPSKDPSGKAEPAYAGVSTANVNRNTNTGWESLRAILRPTNNRS